MSRLPCEDFVDRAELAYKIPKVSIKDTQRSLYSRIGTCAKKHRVTHEISVSNYMVEYFVAIRGECITKTWATYHRKVFVQGKKERDKKRTETIFDFFFRYIRIYTRQLFPSKRSDF